MASNATASLLFKTEMVGGKPMIFWNATGELAPARNKAPNGRMEKAATFEGAAAMQNGKSTSFIDRNKSRAVRPVAVQNRNVGQAERAAPVMKPRPVRRAEDDDTVKLTKAQLNALLQAVTNGASLEDDDLADSGAAMRAGQRNVRQRSDSPDDALRPGAFGQSKTKANAFANSSSKAINAAQPKAKSIMNNKSKSQPKREENIFALLDRAGDQHKARRVVLASDTNERIGNVDEVDDEREMPAWKRNVRTVREQQLKFKDQQRKMRIEAQFEALDPAPKPVARVKQEPSALEKLLRMEKPKKVVELDDDEPSPQQLQLQLQILQLQHQLQQKQLDESMRTQLHLQQDEQPRATKEVRIAVPQPQVSHDAAPSHAVASVGVGVATTQSVSLAEKKREKWAAEQRELQQLSQRTQDPFGRPGGGAPNAPAAPNATVMLDNPNPSGAREREKQRLQMQAELAQNQGTLSVRADASQPHARGLGLAALMNPLSQQEHDDKRKKQLEHQAAIAAQIQERTRLRELEKRSRMLEDMQHELRIQQENEALKRAAAEEQAEMRAKEQMREARVKETHERFEQERQIADLQRQLERARGGVKADTDVANPPSRPANAREAERKHDSDSPRDASAAFRNRAAPRPPPAPQEPSDIVYAAGRQSGIPHAPAAAAATAAPARNAVRTKLQEAALDNVIDDLGWKPKQKQQQQQQQQKQKQKQQTPQERGHGQSQLQKARSHLRALRPDTPPDAPPPLPPSPPVPAVQKRVDLRQAYGDEPDNALDNQFSFEQEVYRDQDAASPPLRESQFAPFVRTAEVLDPARALSPTHVSREPSSVERARRSYERHLDPALRGNPPQKNNKPFASRPLIRGSLMNADQVTGAMLASSGNAGKLLEEIKRGLVQRRRELEVTMPNTEFED